MADFDKEVPDASDATREEATHVSLPVAVEPAVVIVTDGLSEGALSNASETKAHDSQPMGDTAISSPSSSSTPASGAPPPSVNLSQPKRFSAVNINKKFLEKTSSSASATQTSSNSTTAKSGGAVSRPSVQPPTSHSRLVTAKLTMTAQSSVAGSGWSRPPSATPSLSSPGPVAGAPSGPSPASLSSAPQLPHAGKVIQPQPRTLATTSSKGSQRDGAATSSKPVWGNVKTTTALNNGSASIKEHNDFPTAAEVAQVSTSTKKAKPLETKEIPEAVASSYNQTRIEAADTFRGVHLDPNTHHWDEMSEDDDNFLDGIIEFGDGRQYTVQAAASPPPGESLPIPGDDASSMVGDTTTAQSTTFVSKEERFLDDFDRSWPRSKPSPVSSQQDIPVTGKHAISPPSATSHNISSTQETSRVLFNERSNKLEPYSNTSHRTSQGAFSTKRGSHSGSTSPAEFRNSRDLPLHSQSQNVQLLQKSGSGHGYHHDVPSRPRGSSTSLGTNTGNTFQHERPWGNDVFRREAMPGPLSRQTDSRRNRDHHNNQFGPPPTSPIRDRDSNIDTKGSRSSTMGLPPPPPLRGYHKDTGRQLPPHLSQTQHYAQTLQTGLPQEPVVLTSPTVTNKDPGLSPGSSSSLLPAQSPLLSHDPLTPSVASPNVMAGLPGVDIDEVRKDVMQSAAARAKERRKREEEERDKEKERARKKAAELEALIKAAEAEKQKSVPDQLTTLDVEVVKFIEEATKNAEYRQTDVNTNPALQGPPSQPQPIGRRPPSLKGLQQSPADHARHVLPRRLSQTSASAPNSAASQADSWRTKAPVSATPPSAPPTLQPTSVFPEHPYGFQEDYELNPDVAEDLEVVDFSELGKFVGDNRMPTPNAAEVTPGPISRPARPVASDFFQDSTDTSTKNDLGSWRRKDADRDHPQPSEEDVSQAPETLGISSPPDVGPSPVGIQPSSASLSTYYPNQTNTQEFQNSPSRHGPVPHYGQQRTPRSATFHKEADLSAWDNAMSRIKGALDGMQTVGPARLQDSVAEVDPHPNTGKTLVLPPSPTLPKSVPPKEPRWVPPALRQRHADLDIQSREVFLVSRDESLGFSHSSFTIRLPSVSRFLEQPSRRQQNLMRAPVHVRWEILSWDPPVEGMHRREFSLNDVLFRKPLSKGKPRYRVLLPRSRLRTARGPATGPRVHLPANTAQTTRPNTTAYFGKVSEVDGLSTWRKPVSPAVPNVEIVAEMEVNSVLDTVSKSPPPELPQDRLNTASLPKPEASLVSTNEPVLVRTRSQPKMPAGSVVAFYRDAKIDIVDSDRDTGVTFIVTSELEALPPASPPSSRSEKPGVRVASPLGGSLPNGTESGTEMDPLNTMINGLKSQPASPEYDVPALVQSKTESKSSDSTDRMPITPPSHHASTSWATFSLKESPARPPDPEHLKAVWSQASDKPKLPVVNSLEGIGDDLTALPFTLQDVKSEDGETPPPSVIPNRMTMHDVTRAFQQVPSSTSSPAVPRVTPLPPSSSSVSIAQRQQTYTYGLPPSSSTDLRPNFAPYHSPMLSHSPSPAMMYSQPMQSNVPRMPVNGHTSVYSPQLWVPLSGPTPPNNMRPLASPYPAQMVPYPSPSNPAVYGPPGGIPPNLAAVPSQNNTPARGRMPLMSPVMSHVGPHPNVPLYAGSPVLMHAPIMQVPQGHATYLPVPTGRRNEPPGHPPLQQPHQVPPHNSPYTAFGRPSW